MLEQAYARYEAALHGVERFGIRLRREGYPTLQIERVEQLSQRLSQRYARYKASGDLAPLRAEIERFIADPWGLNPQEDGMLSPRLESLLIELSAGVPELTLTVSDAAPLAAPSVPAGFLTFEAPALTETAVTR